ncbi:hypothetical protein QEM27_003526 [Pseudomonas putida]|nr:hypothetical protein [Pseudomonas putida]EKT8866481.1 hypothetical protein [Pseudomonas putida]
MSLKLNERYPLRFNNPSAQYPQGSFKNRSAPNAKDGSYLEQDWANDKEGFFQRLLVAAGIAPNGLVDTAENSQYFDALAEIINSSVSVPDATTLVKGISRFGSIAEQVAGLSNTIMTNPAGVMALLTSWFPKRTFAASDYIRIPDQPGGLIINFGSAAYGATSGSVLVTATLVAAYPNAHLLTIPTVDSNSDDVFVGWSKSNSTLSTAQFTVRDRVAATISANAVQYISIGY